MVLELRRQKYANLSHEKRQEHVNKVIEARKKKKDMEVQPNSSKVRQKRKEKVVWLLRALCRADECEGELLYQPVCSGLHELEPMKFCQHCHAKKFQFEPPTFCCDNGKIRLATSEVPPDLLHLFTDSESIEAREFRKNVRVYNSIFSFTSFGAHIDKDLASSRQGVYTFRVLGQVYQSLPGLLPDEDGPSYFQLYFWDVQNELQNRMNIMDNTDLNEETMKKLMKVMETNPYAMLLCTINDGSIDDTQLHIHKNAGRDQSRSNSPPPPADEVAAIWVEGNNPNIPYDRWIIHARDGRRHRIKHYFGCYGLLQYVLLFPMGDNGWHQNILKCSGTPNNEPIQENVPVQTNFSSVQNIIDQEQQAIEDTKNQTTKIKKEPTIASANKNQDQKCKEKANEELRSTDEDEEDEENNHIPIAKFGRREQKSETGSGKKVKQRKKDTKKIIQTKETLC